MSQFLSYQNEMLNELMSRGMSNTSYAMQTVFVEWHANIKNINLMSNEEKKQSFSAYLHAKVQNIIHSKIEQIEQSEKAKQRLHKMAENGEFILITDAGNEKTATPEKYEIYSQDMGESKTNGDGGNTFNPEGHVYLNSAMRIFTNNIHELFAENKALSASKHLLDLNFKINNISIDDAKVVIDCEHEGTKYNVVVNDNNYVFEYKDKELASRTFTVNSDQLSNKFGVLKTEKDLSLLADSHSTGKSGKSNITIDSKVNVSVNNSRINNDGAIAEDNASTGAQIASAKLGMNFMGTIASLAGMPGAQNGQNNKPNAGGQADSESNKAENQNNSRSNNSNNSNNTNNTANANNQNNTNNPENAKNSISTAGKWAKFGLATAGTGAVAIAGATGLAVHVVNVSV